MLAPASSSARRLAVRAAAPAVRAFSCASSLRTPSASAFAAPTLRHSHAPAPARSLLCAVGVPARSRTPVLSGARAQSTDASSSSSASSASERQVVATYTAPMARMFRRLKLFSLTTLSLSIGLTPALLLAPGTMPLSARLGVSGAVLATSASATGLIAFVGGPYASHMQLLAPTATRNSHAIELDTYSWRMQPLRTTIFDPSVVRPTERPFATWEVSLAAPASIPISDASEGAALPERILAETRNLKTGALLGRFVARYSRDALTRTEQGWKADGVIVQEGQPLRHFQVHEELLDEAWQVLE